jgi:hypothetical protein
MWMRDRNNVDIKTRIVFLANMRTVSDIIEALGGSASIARELGLKASAVSEMKRRQSIPVKYWPGLIRLSQGRGAVLDADALVVAHAPEPSASEAAA